MDSIMALLGMDVLALIILGYYDFKQHSVPKVYAVILIALIILFETLFMIDTFYLAMSLFAVGCIIWVMMMIGRVFSMQKWETFDSLMILVTLITLPFISLMALLINQGILIGMARLRGEPFEVPILTLYAVSFILSTIAFAYTLGLNSLLL